ncbi:MAG TPA: malto-oligosyltrehalose synthase, partial [Cyanothece sp. UBA12306]|nr:malto-oligosyltrehalose synthase [Cyanothece sp. UBA12306]
THGYDVVDYHQINPDLGTEEDFKTLVEELQELEMGWLQDIVPNHMAYDSQNKYLMDVLENGPYSDYFDYFDIDWEHPYVDIKGKILTPLLGDFYGNCLKNGEIKLRYDEEGFSINYYQLKIPLRIESYAKLIEHDFQRVSDVLGDEHNDIVKILGILYSINNIAQVTDKQKRKGQSSFVKTILRELYRDNPTIKEFIDTNIEIFNNEIEPKNNYDLLDELLNEQFFRLSFWKVGAEELNYRRFFTINELICLKNENHKVFDDTHELIIDLVKDGYITGLRIDHVDGLYNPTDYLERLREKTGDIYIVVEKIIELEKAYFSRQEEMPITWPIQGTSGYDFLDCVNSLFVFYQEEAPKKITNIYHKLTAEKQPYQELVIEKKRLIADKNLAGDVENLTNILKNIAGKYRYGRDFTLNGLRKAIVEVLVFFPVYRTYITGEEIQDSDQDYIKEAIQKAKNQIPQLVNEFNFIQKILLLEDQEFLTEEERKFWLYFVMKFQQASSPLTAKGVEDTALYVYHRLVSLNEVGGTPDLLGISTGVFHYFNQKRQDHWAHSLNSTSTHDTKRSGDVRARINVISEIPDEWENEVTTWRNLNSHYKHQTDKKIIPDGNDEYFLYQTLIGTFPFNETEEYQEFVERIKEYVVKAVREAKVHTAWLKPDLEYEEKFTEFVEKILERTEENQFLGKLRSFQEKIAYYGVFNTLSQTLLKMTSPGVPDFYQGTELWDFSLVDPDNRRPVDFEKRARFLEELQQQAEDDIFGLMDQLLNNYKDGRIKLFLIYRTLLARQKNPELFEKGAYIPLEVNGEYQENMIAFARYHNDTTAITIVPRFLTRLVEPYTRPLGTEIWGDTQLVIPHTFQTQWTEVFSNRKISPSDTIPIGEVLQHFPVALLIADTSE